MADSRVTHAVNAKISREQAFTRKSYGNVEANKTYNDTIEALPPEPEWNSVKKALNKSLVADVSGKWSEHIHQLVMQGELLKLIEAEQSDLTWRSCIYNLPHKVLKFAINASIDTLPTFRNLKQWGKRNSDHCPLCSNKQSLVHVLNACKHMLNDGRYTWRHNSVLKVIYDKCKLSPLYSSDSIRIYADLPGCDLNGSTLPPDILVTSFRPDITIISPERVIIVELTVPFEMNAATQHQYKVGKYSPIADDIIRGGKDCSLLCLEIGSRGCVDTSSRQTLTTLLKKLNLPLSEHKNNLIKSVSTTALMSSFYLFKRKDEISWMDPPLLAFNTP